MTAKAVWIAGLAGLAVLSGIGLYRLLPAMENDLKVSVDQALTQKGLDQIKAEVSGQTVTLSARSVTSEATAQLAEARATLGAVTMNAPFRPGGKLVNSPISKVQVANLPVLAKEIVVTSVSAAPPVLAPAPTQKSQPIDIIHGDGATAVASVDDLPRVAGDSALDASTQAARACDQDLASAVANRQVSYQPGTYTLTFESERLIGDVYKAVSACPVRVRVTVSGYTDNLGDGLVNQTISKAKAQAAADALIARGVAPGRVTVRGFGGALPVADNITAEGRARNRRVVFTVNAG
jgi:outer membrane protein OmpA-like peptidoglycan-associated protein